MELFIEKNQCCGCMACIDACPRNAVSTRPDSEGFLYPEIKQELCVNCNRCREVCPMTATEPVVRRRRYIAAQAKDQKMCEVGTSGGVFPVLADYVLENGGVVYGAAFDESMRVVHQRAANKDELARLTRSKYIQSDTTGIFRRVRKDLQVGLQTLFVGTPCQTEALRRFLLREYPNLLLVDLVCYGVPSPGLWKSYVAYLEKKHNGQLTEFRFREKEMHGNEMTAFYKIDGREYEEAYFGNAFVTMYFSNCMLRPSCHTCLFTRIKRNSDITLGDFWKAEERLPQMDNGKGKSLVILHSEKGMRFWNHIEDQFYCRECSENEVIQPRLISPSPPSPHRRLFFGLYRRVPFSVFIAIFCRRVFRRFWRGENST